MRSKSFTYYFKSLVLVYLKINFKESIKVFLSVNYHRKKITIISSFY